MILNTPNVRMDGTVINSEDVERNVIKGTADLVLVMEPFVDESLFGRELRFSANFRIIRATDNHVINHYFDGDVDELIRPVGPFFSMSMSWSRAESAGVRGGGAGHHRLEGRGMYVYRPYLVIDAVIVRGRLYQPTGLSEFAVSEDHYFWVE